MMGGSALVQRETAIWWISCGGTIASLFGAVLGCGEDRGSNVNSVKTPVASIAIEVHVSATVLTEGEKGSVIVSLVFEDGTKEILPPSVCEVGDTGIVALDTATGILTAIAEGSTTLVCRSGSLVSDVVSLEVLAAPDVPNPPPPPTTVINPQPIPFKIVTTPSEGVAPLDVHVRFQGTIRRGNDPRGRGEVYYLVDWGDGSGSCIANLYLDRVRHEYFLAGKYVIRAAGSQSYPHPECLTDSSSLSDRRPTSESFDPQGTTEVRVDPMENPPLSVAAGDGFSCVVRADRKVVCAGGGLKNLVTLPGGFSSSDGLPIDTSGAVRAVAGGYTHACSIGLEGTANCWGRNASGQLGDGSTQDSDIPRPVSGVSGALEVDLGVGHTCVLLESGRVDCWGDNQYGQLGTGTLQNTTLPASVNSISAVLSVSVGGNHACGALQDGSAVCWGLNDFGQLGDGTTFIATTPVVVASLTSVASLAAGMQHTCGLLVSGEVHCWGDNSVGTLGREDISGSNVPTPVPGVSGMVSIAASENRTCGLSAEGGIYCWGEQGYPFDRVLLDGRKNVGPSQLPPFVLRRGKAVSISAKGANFCSLLEGGPGRCWGMFPDTIY